MYSGNEFWVVWCRGGGSPVFEHGTYNAAHDEAVRLARENSGRQFVVLRAIRGFMKDDIRETDFEGPGF